MLLYIYRYMRKDKDIAEGMLDVQKAENSRLKQQLQYVRKEVTDTNKTLADERQAAQVQLI